MVCYGSNPQHSEAWSRMHPFTLMQWKMSFAEDRNMEDFLLVPSQFRRLRDFALPIRQSLDRREGYGWAQNLQSR